MHNSKGAPGSNASQRGGRPALWDRVGLRTRQLGRTRGMLVARTPGQAVACEWAGQAVGAERLAMSTLITPMRVESRVINLSATGRLFGSGASGVDFSLGIYFLGFLMHGYDSRPRSKLGEIGLRLLVRELRANRGSRSSRHDRISASTCKGREASESRW